MHIGTVLTRWGRLLHGSGLQPVSYAPPRELGKRYSSFFCALMHPLSRGTVHIASSDPLAPPAIDPNYFANAADLDLVAHTVEVALKLCQTEPLARHVRGQLIPGKDVLAKGREGIKEYVKQNCGPVWHPVGTAAMLLREDGGVVDSTLKVYGTSNLRVVSIVLKFNIFSVAHPAHAFRLICLSCLW